MRFFLIRTILLLGIIIFSSCEDIIFEKYQGNVPIYMTYDELRNSVRTVSSREIEKPGKICFYNDYILVNEYLEGIHIFDNRNPSSPTLINFIKIPGSTDILVKDGLIYSDSYIDLVVIDINDISNIKETFRVENIFPYSLPPTDNDYRIARIQEYKGVVIGWEESNIEERINKNSFPFFDSYDYESSFKLSDYSSIGIESGVNSNKSRFAVEDDFLYVIDNDNLSVFAIYEGQTIFEAIGYSYIGFTNTIFALDEYLYIGTDWGTKIISIESPGNPYWISDFTDISSCDPVVIVDDLAYVAHRIGNDCEDNGNKIDLIDISDKEKPSVLKSFSMTNPYGIDIKDTLLFVSEGYSGLKIFNIKDPYELDKNLIVEYNNIDAFNATVSNGTLFIVDDNGLKQYQYEDIENIELLSSIAFSHIAK